MGNWEKNVRKISPYVPGEQPQQKNVIKLNTNENPYPPCPEIKRILAGYDTEQFRLYPDPDSRELTEAIAADCGAAPSQVFVGVGSDDVLSIAFLTFFNSELPILFPDVTYSFYNVWAKVYRIPYETKPLNDNFRIQPEDYFCKNGGIVFPNPNAPTGVFEELDQVEKIIAANPDSVVIVDEAYIDFGGKSCLPLLKKYSNLLVVRTFSKSRSMAGARIGFAVGSEKLISYMNDVKFSINSYTMNRLSQLCGTAAIKDSRYFEETVGKIISTRERAKVRFRELGFDLTDSMANFLFVTHKDIPAGKIFEELKKRSIFVRHWDLPRIDDRLRVTIGTDDQMEQLFSALSRIV